MNNIYLVAADILCVVIPVKSHLERENNAHVSNQCNFSSYSSTFKFYGQYVDHQWGSLLPSPCKKLNKIS